MIVIPRSQVNFKATAYKGAWTTYFRSFIPDVWVAYGVAIVGILGAMILINVVSMTVQSSRTGSKQGHRYNFLGTCFMIFGMLCQQGKCKDESKKQANL